MGGPMSRLGWALGGMVQDWPAPRLLICNMTESDPNHQPYLPTTGGVCGRLFCLL
ncbi:uncharacterized protein PgNI_01335 [Pyricularia grisea]|uniref:Uncharacterized protein n=1 Tax=Pyricularia grisea TaxID=148305 RepID=A0A6P8BIR9_PYRGI|nr:uncharacterized protein PgNI_01335 [Pyricularia grisea]TLD16610.1 hypothetical protein PgNI_01335 [Pyricularia grisea]